jgi:hypothetical protein
LGERGQFRRRQDGFNFHFASREGRDGGEGNLQSIYILGIIITKTINSSSLSKMH